MCSTVVLMPFDGSLQAVRTFPLAQTIARATEGSLHVVLPGKHARARERLNSLAKPQAVLHEMPGDLASGIARLASFSPDAFIVTPAYTGTRPESGLGSFQEQLLRLAESPVLLVQPSEAWGNWKPARILVPLDGAACTARALCPAARLAARAGSEVLVLHVSSERPSTAPEPGALECPAYADHPEHEWPSWVAGFLERVRHLCSMSPQTLLRFHWALGDPGREIVDMARRKGVDLISVSWNRRLGLGHSQVLRSVFRDAPCPILVLPGNLPGLEGAPL
jgi:nucleotide-binding universal stress UspA family protein